MVITASIGGAKTNYSAGLSKYPVSIHATGFLFGRLTFLSAIINV